MNGEEFLRCGNCGGIIAIARIDGEKSLVCHCTHDDGKFERVPLAGGEMPYTWQWE